MRWTAIGVKTTYIGTEPPALKVASPAADGRPDKNPKYDWKLIQPAAGKQGPSIAMSDGTPDRTKTVIACADNIPVLVVSFPPGRSEEHTSELQSLMRISYAVFCLKQKNTIIHTK